MIQIPIFLAAALAGTQAPPYLEATADQVEICPLLTVGDTVPSFDGFTRLVGVPDGMGWFADELGTTTLLVNHELSPSAGVPRRHGAPGAFVSRWRLDPLSREIIEGEDLIHTVHTWSPADSAYTRAFPSFCRLCSADLPRESAFYHEPSGQGTRARILTGGEECLPDGRAFAHFATGALAGQSFDLPRAGHMSFENVVASPFAQEKTILVCLEDTYLGELYVYVGTKDSTGTDLERAGLTNGRLYGIIVDGFPREDQARGRVGDSRRFALHDFGDVSAKDGMQLATESRDAGITQFLRPEDGHWDPLVRGTFYFVTTGQLFEGDLGLSGDGGGTRLFALRFDDITRPILGGRIEILLDGTEPETLMFDNLTVDGYGHVIIQEDPGYVERAARIWRYDLASGGLEEVARHNPALFGDLGRPPTPPFNPNEESSGIVDAAAALGPGWYLLNVQAHAAIYEDPELIEMGQLLALYDPAGDRSALRLEGLTPGHAGVPNTLRVRGAEPGAHIELSWAGRPGYTPVEGCPALSLQSEPLGFLEAVVADSSGLAEFSARVPHWWEGLDRRLQARDAAGCWISDVLETVFVAPVAPPARAASAGP